MPRYEARNCVVYDTEEDVVVEDYSKVVVLRAAAYRQAESHAWLLNDAEKQHRNFNRMMRDNRGCGL